MPPPCLEPAQGCSRTERTGGNFSGLELYKTPPFEGFMFTMMAGPFFGSREQAQLSLRSASRFVRNST